MPFRLSPSSPRSFRTFAAASAALSVVALTAAPSARANAATTFPGIVIAKTYDGTPLFDATAADGNDTGDDNNTVRAGDLVGYKFTFNLNDQLATSPTTYNNYTMTSNPLPVGFVWDAVPPSCVGPGSVIQGSGTVASPSVLVCNMLSKTTGDVWSMSANVRALPSVAPGTAVDVTGTVKVDLVPNTATFTANDPVKATSAPKFDLQKGSPTWVGSKIVDGKIGYVYTYGIAIKMKPGSMEIAQPITFSDDFSGLPGTGVSTPGDPKTQLYVDPANPGATCGTNGLLVPTLNYTYRGGFPVGKRGQGYNSFGGWNDPLRAVSDSGAITCTPASASVTNITISGVDSNPALYPKFDMWGTPLIAGDRWIVADYISYWIPAEAFTASNSYQGISENKLQGFNPAGKYLDSNGVTQIVPGTGFDPGAGMNNQETVSQTALKGTENNYKSIIYRPSPGGFDKFDYRLDSTIPFPPSAFVGDMTGTSNWSRTVGSDYRTGDGVLAQGSKYLAFAELNFTATTDIPAGFINCMTIDNSNVKVAPLTGNPTRGAYLWNYPAGVTSSQQGAGWVIEYGTGGIAGAGTTWASQTAEKNGTCADGESTGGIWHTDITAVPGGAGAITKIRARSASTFTVAEQMASLTLTGSGYDYARLQVQLEVLPTAVIGTVVPNYQKVYDPGIWFGTGPVSQTNLARWYQPTYEASTALGSLGDRITVSGTQVRVKKKVDTNQRLVGFPSMWTLTPTSDALGINPAGLSVNTKMVDTLPAGLWYTAGSAECAAATAAPVTCEPTVVVNPDGTTTLSWDFGTFTAGSSMSVVTFRTISDRTLADGESRTNTVVVSAANDNSPVAWRTSTDTVILSNPAAFSVNKRAMDPLVEEGDPFRFRLTYRNTSADTYAKVDFIDWLPYVGDNRTPPSAFTGTVKMTAFSQIAGTSIVRFTKATPSLPADLDPNTANASILWCLETQFGTTGCPTGWSEVTGLRFTETDFPPRETGILQITLDPTANTEGDIYTNRFAGRVQGLPLPVESNNVNSRVVMASIGDRVWLDANDNGTQDATEVGVAGVTVELLDASGNPIDSDPNTLGVQPTTTTTDNNGNYLFRRLYQGAYTVRFTQPADLRFTNPSVNGSTSAGDALDSDPEFTTGLTPVINLAKGEELTNIDAGLVRRSGAITITKKINGNDAEAVPGVGVVAGSVMNVSFDVTNTGAYSLSDVSVTDSTISRTDITCPKSVLAPAETMTCTATHPAPAVAVQHQNTASVVGTPPPFPDGTTVASVKATNGAYAHVPTQPSIAIVKKVNGIDANTAPGASVAPGSTMSFTFDVTNTGNIVLNPVTVTDSVIATSAITCPKIELRPAESMQCTASLSAPAVGGTHTNTGTATGTPPVTPDVPDPKPVSATDLANAWVQQPRISVVKKINGADADTAPGATVAYPSTMNITFDVTNTGNVRLSPVVVTDSVVADTAISCPTTSLDPGESMQCVATLAAPAPGIQHTNEATVTGQPPAYQDGKIPPIVKATNPANAASTPAPAITIIKKVNGDDADTAPGASVIAGSTMNFTFDVTNTGNTPLANVKVTDTLITNIVCPTTSLAVGAAMQCTGTKLAPGAGIQHTNTATVVGSPTAFDGKTALIDLTTGAAVRNVSAMNNANALPIQGQLTLIKRINGDDANTAPGVLVRPGSTMSISFEVRNVGTAALSAVKVTDPVLAAAGAAITCPATTLAVGAAMTCTAQMLAPAAGVQHTNVGTVTGQPMSASNPTLPLGTPITTSDPANAIGANPSIRIIKQINGNDADSIPGVEVPRNAPMNITFDVTNTGNTSLNPVTVTDSVIPASSISCPKTNLAPAEAMKCTATLAPPAPGIRHQNLSRVSGTPIGTNGVPIPAMADVTDKNEANAFTVAQPAITIVKKINGADADAAPGYLAPIGSLLQFTFDVTNTGDVRLNPVVVTDSVVDASAIACPATALDAGATMQCTATLPAPEAGGRHTNIGNVTGTPVGVDGVSPLLDVSTETPTKVPSVFDANGANAWVAKPNITIVKKINGDDANNAPGVLVAPNEIMDITFDVTNTGDVPLDSVTISDDKVPTNSISCPATSLAAGATMQCTAALAAPSTVGTQHTNAAVVVGTPIDPTEPGRVVGPDVRANDTANAYAVKPRISIVKTVNDADANTAPGIDVYAGSAMQFRFVVTNSGDVTLDSVSVTDDVIPASSIVCPKTKLSTGEQMVCTASLAAPASGVLHTNIATVTGTPVDDMGKPIGKPPVASDPANATSVRAGVSIVKKINGEDANISPGVGVELASTMDIRYEITNTGTTMLQANITDNVLTSAAISCDRSVLAPAEMAVCFATYPAPAFNEVHTNIGTVTATPIRTDGTPWIDPGTGVQIPDLVATDPANAHPVARPRLIITKFINGNDAESAPGVEVSANDIVTFTFRVRNAGNTDLSDVTVTDSVIASEFIICPSTKLKVGETMTCTARVELPAGVHHNTATTTGTPIDKTGKPIIVGGVPTPKPLASNDAWGIVKTPRVETNVEQPPVAEVTSTVPAAPRAAPDEPTPIRSEVIPPVEPSRPQPVVPSAPPVLPSQSDNPGFGLELALTGRNIVVSLAMSIAMIGFGVALISANRHRRSQRHN